MSERIETMILNRATRFEAWFDGRMIAIYSTYTVPRVDEQLVTDEAVYRIKRIQWSKHEDPMVKPYIAVADCERLRRL